MESLWRDFAGWICGSVRDDSPWFKLLTRGSSHSIQEEHRACRTPEISISQMTAWECSSINPVNRFIWRPKGKLLETSQEDVTLGRAGARGQLRSKAAHPNYSWKILSQPQQAALRCLMLAETLQTAATLARAHIHNPWMSGNSVCAAWFVSGEREQRPSPTESWLPALAGICVSTRRNPTQALSKAESIENEAHH